MSNHFIRADQRYELISLALELMHMGKRLAMVTLVNVEGSSPYPVGTQMLVLESGEYRGQITGGCAEKSIADQAVAAIISGENCVQRYGLSSPYFDIKLPCGSGIDVFINVTTTLPEYQTIHRSLVARTAINQTLNINQKTDKKITTKTDDQNFEKHYIPNPRLILLGQGPILMKTSLTALAAGFDVMCVAQNDETLTLAKQCNLGAVALEKCVELASICDPFTGLISLFHEHDFELNILSKALKTNAFYIGALGSKQTHLRRLESLRECGIDEVDLLRVHGPVGVNISVNTPAQIAISIIAQAIDELNKASVNR